jgi:hypothetical protein
MPPLPPISLSHVDDNDAPQRPQRREALEMMRMMMIYFVRKAGRHADIVDDKACEEALAYSLSRGFSEVRIIRETRQFFGLPRQAPDKHTFN